MTRKEDSKKTTNKSDDEHQELDVAMSELARQTDALLAEAKPKQSNKPKLPKKKSSSRKLVPHRNGQHLDIVGSSMTSKPAQTEKKLPAHASYSYNEKNESKTPTKSEPSSAAPRIIRPHEGVALAGKDVASQPDAKPKSAHEEAETPTRAADADEHMKVKVDDTEEKITVHSHAHVSESAVKHEPPADVDEKSVETHPSTVESTHEQHETSAKTVLKTKSEDADDGIVKIDEEEKADTDMKEKATLFDTAEYQAELHDWSKLSGNSHWPFIILILLLALAGGLMYLYFTGNLPEIG